MTTLTNGMLACVVLTACGGITTTNTNTDAAIDAASQPDASASVDADATCSSATNTQPPPVPLPSGTSCDTTTEPVEAWALGGSSPAKYQFDFGSMATCNAGPSLHLASSTASSSDFGEMGTAKAPAAWLGQRVRLSGWIQSNAVTGWAGLWMRVDRGQTTGIAFDNMQCRAITGTTGWAEYEVVLDVASDATTVAYGVLLAGQGDVWLDGVSVDVTGTCTATTGCP